MLDLDTALDLLNKYGYTSIQVHPFVYQDGDTIGLCYTYVDEDYGLLERIKIFNNAEEFEEFLKMYNWVQTNGKLHHVRMILDNYESINPKTMFLRNEKIMVEGEMFAIEEYDARESLRINMDPVSKIIYETGDLLLVYNEIKNRQLQYLKNIIKLKNALRRKYYELQKEVDKYNKIKVERMLNLLPEVTDSGINESLEASIKDRYNVYIVQLPSYEEALGFLKEVWDLCLQLELNTKYYQAMKEETDIRNETKVVEEKLTYMRELNDQLKPLFGTDLIGRFKKINKECKATASDISVDYINQQMDTVNRKYSFYDKIDPLYTSDYLREATQNSNYADLAIKYAVGTNYEVISKYKTPLNEVAASLSVQYRDKLNLDEQAVLMLYNNPKFRLFCDAILNIENFENVPIKTILRELNKVKGFSKLKSECFDSVKRRIDDPSNVKIKNSIFVNYDFTSFETFISSLVQDLVKLKAVNEKMLLNGDINMYVYVKKVDDINSKLFVMTTNDLPSLIEQAKINKGMVGIVLLKEGTPVLYSPYYFDLGDIYGKGVSPEMFVKEMVNFEILVDVSDIVINIDPNKTSVTKYYSEPNVVGNLSIVDHIKMDYKTKFCKYAFTSKLSTVVQMNQATAVASSVSPVVNSVFDAGTLASVEVATEPVTEAVTEAVTEPVTEVPKTEPLTEPKTEVPKVEPVTEPKTEVQTSAPVTEVPTQPTTQAPVVTKTEPVVVKKDEVKTEPVQKKEVATQPVTAKVETPVVKTSTEPVKVAPATKPAPVKPATAPVKPAVVPAKTATVAQKTATTAPVTKPVQAVAKPAVSQTTSKPAQTTVKPAATQQAVKPATVVKPAQSATAAVKPAQPVAQQTVKTTQPAAQATTVAAKPAVENKPKVEETKS